MLLRVCFKQNLFLYLYQHPRSRPTRAEAMGWKHCGDVPVRGGQWGVLGAAFLIASGPGGVGGGHFAAGRSHTGARTTPTMGSGGRSPCTPRCSRPWCAPRCWPGVAPPLGTLGTRLRKEKETRIPEVPQLLTFPFSTGICFVGSLRRIFMK